MAPKRSSGSTSSGTTAYTLDDPVAGVRKTIVGSTAVGGSATITSTSGVLFGSTATDIVIGETGGVVELIGAGVTRWHVIGQSTGATIS